MAADGGGGAWRVPQFELLEDRIVLDGVPDVQIVGPDPTTGTTSTIDIGDQDVPFTLVFDNTGTDTGYVPYVDLILPSTGADGDDGVTFDSASFLGAPITTTLLTFDGAGEAIHPFAVDGTNNPIVVNGNPGDTLVVLELPYGSFSPGNPAVDIDILLDFSNLADISDTFDIQAIGGFALGCDEFDNPTVDAPIRGTPENHTVAQQLFEVTKVNTAPESDGATGPSYVYSYDLQVDVAAGQTLSAFTLTDTLPPEIVYLGNVNITGGTGTVTTEPPIGALVTAPNDQLVVDFATISGTVNVTFDYYINETSSATSGPVIDPVTGDEVAVTNSVVGDGTWDPLDGRDPVENVSDSDTDVIQARSIAIQKSNAIVAPDVEPPTPGDVYEFTLNLQVSDYFAFGDIDVTDVLGNGWNYLGSAEFTWVEEGSGNATAISLAGFETSTFNAATGETTNVWDISAAMVADGADDLLIGDIANDGSSSGTQTTVQITYLAEVLDQYPATVPGDQEIGQGDTLVNDVTVSGTVRDNADPTTPTTVTEDDTSGTTNEIPTGAIRSKEVFAVNGNPFDPAVPIAAGDQVTFKVIYDAPLGSFENLDIVDNLPQNVFDVTELTVFNDVTNDVPPAPGEAQYGAGDEFSINTPGGTVPVLTTDPPNNGAVFDFSNLSVDPRQPVDIEILFTVTVVDALFAPDLLLTNQATAFESDSFGNSIDTTAIAQFEYSEPVLEITKGVIAFDAADADATLTAPAGPVAFTAPGSAGVRWAGTINSTNLDTTPIDADLDNVDAGDPVSFAIVIENVGRAPNGAFNVNVSDTIPPGYVAPTVGSMNLNISDGAGNPITYDGPAVDTDLFTPGGLVLTDGATTGSVAAFDPTSGANVIVITYDLVLASSAATDATLTNTAAVAEYNAIEDAGAVNRVPAGGLNDDATVTTEEPTIDKTLETRQFGEGDADQVMIGEDITYIVAIEMSEGQYDNAIITDVVTAGGLELVSAEIITYDGANITNTNGLGLGSTVAATGGDTVTFDFGTLNVLGDNSEGNDTIEIRVTARAVDSLVGSAGETLTNRARLDWDGGQVEDTESQTIIEPTLTMAKTATPAVVSAGSTVSYSVDIDNVAGPLDAPAYDLVMTDTLDPNLVLDTGSIQILLDGVDVTGNPGFTVNPLGGNAFEVIVDVLNEGEELIVNYDGTVIPGVTAGVTIPNTANLTFDSTPENEGIGTGAGDDSDDRDYSLSDGAQVTATEPDLVKDIFSTSNPDTTGSDLSIGELVTYEIVVTIPEGTTDAVTLTDVLPTNPPGILDYVSSEVISIGANLSGTGLPAVGPYGTNVGDTTTFAFGDIDNVVDMVTNAADQIVVQLTAVVVDDPANVDGDSLTNTATLDFTDGDGNPGSVSDTETVDVVEPSLDIDKSVVPATADAGDVLTYTVLSTNSGGAPGYDIVIDDSLADAGLTALPTGTLTIRILDGGVDVTPGGADAPSVVFNAGALQAVIPVLDVGQTIEIVYQATVADAALFSSQIPNTASVTRYDSDPAGDENDANGRVYDSGLAGYTVPTDSEQVQTPDATMTKTLIGSSDANTAGADVVVGETVTYELVITVPQGTADLTLTDVMPVGLSAQSASFVRIDNDPGVTSDIPLGSTQNGVGSSNNITIAAAGDSVTFDFGTVVVTGENDAAATDTQIVVQVTALVEDVLPEVADGNSLTNTATLEVDDPGAPGTPLQPDVVDTETVDVVEPDVTIVKSSPIAANPGDTVPYSITLTNNGTGPAYDLEVIDTLSDPFISLSPGSIQVFLNGVLLAPQPTITETAPDGFQVEGMTMLPADQIEIQFDVVLDANAPVAETFVNTATANYDTVEDGDPDSPTGRDDTENDNSGLATVPGIVKTPFTSNVGETDSELGDNPFNLAVGEEVTYRYELTLPEIDMDSVILEDSLPVGMEYVSSAIVPGGFPYGGTLSVTVDPNQRDVEFDFGAVSNPSDGSIGADDVITFEVTARVVDDAAAVAGATLTNTATLTATPQGEPPLDPQVTTADVDVVEPLLTIDKVAPLSVARGADADFTVTVTNDGAPAGPGPAYDVLIADTLDPAFTLNPASIVIELDGSVITPTVTTTANTFSFTVPVVDVGSVVTVDYTATLGAGATPVVAYQNNATADYTSAPGGNPDERTYPTVSDTESVSTDPTLTKTAIDTNDALTGSGEHDPAQLDLTIGETVTYELVMTLPEIPMDQVVLTDTLPAGLTFVSASVDTVGAEVAFGSNTITDVGQTVTYTFNNVTNTANGTIDADDQITVLLTARVNDIPANVDGAEIINTSTLTVTPQGEPPLNQATATEEIDVVEPALTIDKVGNIAVAPGQTVSYTATITNTGTAPAYDAFIQDTLGDPFLTLDTGTVTVVLDGTDVTALLTIVETASGFEFVLFDAGTPAPLPIEVGDSLVVTYDATLSAAAPEAQSFVNNISADYDTIGDGDPDSPDGRDYNTTDDHAVATVPFVDKNAISSTFTETDSTTGSDPFQLAIGEEVTFQYDIYLPEIDMDSVVIQDTLPAGLSFVSFNVVDLGVPPMLDTSNNPLGPPTFSQAGQVLTFDFGDVRNPFDGSIGADDQITLEVTAVVTDLPSNTAGTVLTNAVELDVDPTGDPPFPTRTNSADVEIVEPLLTIDKTGPLVVDPGDDIDYVLTIENVGPAGGNAGPAYDVIVTDNFPPEIALNPASLVFRIDGVVIAPTVVATATGFTATIPVLDAGETLTVDYTGTLSAAVSAPESFANTAGVNYDSAPGNDPDERTYSEETDDHRVATPPLLDKDIIATSLAQTGDGEHDPANPDLSIGETITYEMVITLPEIPMDDVTLTDTLPVGLSFVSADITAVGSEITGVTTTDEPTVISVAGQVVTLAFGALDNAFSDGVIDANDEIRISIVARVDDIPSVNDGDVLTNSAELIVTPEGEAPLTPVTDETSADIVEPDVTIVKDVSDNEPMQGDVITYTVTVTNDAAATGPAMNLVVQDPLPAQLSLTGTVGTTGAPATVTSSTGTTLIISIPLLQPGDSVTITYDVFIGYSTPVFTDVVNTATVTGGTTDDPGNPGRPITEDDPEIIEVEPVPDPPFEEPERLVGGGIDDERFLPLLLIDPIYTGTAEYGSNVTISLYQWDGSLSYVRNVVADAGGHWIAIFPRVQLMEVEDDFHQRYENSVLFREPVQYMDDRVGFDRNGAPVTGRTFFVGTELEDDSYTVSIDHDRPSTLQQDRGMFNARVFFAPATIGEPYARGDVLSVDEVFEGVADVSVQRLYEASVDPLATGLNRFNYEFLSEETALPGGSAR